MVGAGAAVVTRWFETLRELACAGEPCVLVTVAGVRGSAPREVGARMIVTARDLIGTIGGGQLEYQCAQIAGRQIRDGNEDGLLRKFPLGADCGQCCGGVVDVMFETIGQSSRGWLDKLGACYDAGRDVVIATRLDAPGTKYIFGAAGCEYATADRDDSATPAAMAKQMPGRSECAQQVDGYLVEPLHRTGFNIAVFGAGHVGAAVVDVLSRLDVNIRWIDGRKRIFPERTPANVLAISSADVAREAIALPAGSYYLVMTHSHPLDLEICARVLGRDDFAYCGLIGSVSKRRRFERLLRKQGMLNERLERLTCPIGIAGIAGKQPVEIALAVAAELLRTRDELAHASKGGDAARLRVI